MGFKEKIKKNKKKIVLVGAAIVTVIGVVLLIKNRNKIEGKLSAFFCGKTKEGCRSLSPVCESINSVCDVVTEQKNTSYASNTKESIVRQHRRKLPNGWKTSFSKMKLASEKGINLNDGETWVEEYHKNCA